MQAGPGMAEVISIVKFTWVEFTMEITSAAGRTKLKNSVGLGRNRRRNKKKTHQTNSRNSRKNMPKSEKITENGVPGRSRGRSKPRARKKCKKWSGFGLDLAPFRLHFETFVEVFFNVFF